MKLGFFSYDFWPVDSQTFLLPVVQDTDQEMLTVTSHNTDLNNTNSSNNNSTENVVEHNDSAEDDNDDDSNDEEDDDDDGEDTEDNSYMVPVAFEVSKSLEPSVVTSTSAQDFGQNASAPLAAEQHRMAKRTFNQRVVVRNQIWNCLLIWMSVV